MKKKTKKFLIKFIALFLCVVFLFPMIFACGEKPADTPAVTDAITEGEAPANVETGPPATEPPPTDPPPTTEPPPTEPPLPPFVADPNLPYWEQIRLELEYYGLKDGVFASNGADEAEAMKRYQPQNAKKAELEITAADNVPFSSAYRVTVAKDTASYGSVEYKANLAKDKPIKQDDLVIGVFWIKGERLSETEQFSKDDAPQYFLAVKSSTDSGRTEGDVTPNGAQTAYAEWHKVFFYGRILNEDTKSNNIDFRFFLGYGNQQIDVGGVVVYLFPYSAETEAAAIKLVGSNK